MFCSPCWATFSIELSFETSQTSRGWKRYIIKFVASIKANTRSILTSLQVTPRLTVCPFDLTLKLFLSNVETFL